MPEENQNANEFRVVKETRTIEEIHSTKEPTKSDETQKEPTNTVATVGMRFSIIGLILLITIIFGGFGVMLLALGFILGIIGLFSKPRAKARVAICIPLAIFVAITSVVCYVWNSVKTPVNEFIEWIQPQIEQLENDENFDGELFGDILESELNNMTDGKTEDDWKELFESSTGSNSLEKGAYMISSMFKEGFEISLEKYNEGYIPEIDDEDNKIITIDIDVEDEEDEEDEDNDEEDSNNIEPEEEEEEITIEQPKKQNKETFSQSEKNDIEQILNILE